MLSLPVTLLVALASVCGLSVCFLFMWVLRTAAWISALTTIAAVNSTTMGLSFLRGSFRRLRRTEGSVQPLPVVSFNEIRNIYASISHRSTVRYRPSRSLIVSPQRTYISIATSFYAMKHVTYS